MKQTWPLLLLFFVSQIALGQDYANDWIRPNQPYVKLSVAEDAIYRVDQNDLLQAGHDLSQINPDYLHLFFRGKEQLLFVQKNQQGKLSYVEFLGKKLDGRDDVSMYRDPLNGVRDSSLQTHPYVSLYSDTAAYFLTWDQNPSSYRYFNHFDPTYQSHTLEPSFRYKAVFDHDSPNFPSSYTLGGGGPYEAFYSLNPDYVLGEGYAGPLFTKSAPFTLLLDSPFPVNNPSTLAFEFRIFGQSSTIHILSIILNGNTADTIVDTTINASRVYIKNFKRSITYPQALSSTTQFDFKAFANPDERNQIVKVSMTYDRLFILGNDKRLTISDWEKPTDAYMKFAQVDGLDTAYVYDETNQTRNVGLIRNQRAQVIVQGFQNKRDLFFSTDAGILRPRISSPLIGNLSNTQNGAELLIITHISLENSAEAYASYRDTNLVNPLTNQIVYIEDIYEEFGYGSPTPLAIQRFCNYALQHWQVSPNYILLWGKAEDQIRNHPDNLLPSYGNPASDHYFVVPLDAAKYENIRPQIPIGRVNVQTNGEGLAYLAKVRDYESQADIDWMQKAVFLSGGINSNQQSIMQNILYDKKTFFENSGFQRQGFLCSNDTLFPSDTACYSQIDEGVGLIHFFGHSTSNIQDIDIGEANTYGNFGKYPLIIAMGCNGGNFTVPSSFGERWLTEPGRGAIAYIGATTFSFLNSMKNYGNFLYPSLFSQRHQRLGDVLHETTLAFMNSDVGIMVRNHGLQFNLQGDPSLLWRGKETLTSRHPLQPSIAFKVFPNPATSQVIISYKLPKRGYIELSVLDIHGRKIDRFSSKMGAGTHEFEWNRPDGLSKGIYFIQVMYKDFMYNQKLLIQD